MAERNEYRFHFRAWTPEEAAQHLTDQLAENDVEVEGEIRVLDANGAVLLRRGYGPLRATKNRAGVRSGILRDE